MSGNPFDDETRAYVVVVNQENQHALWPAPVGVPEGWSTVFGPAAHGDCLAYVDRSWTDMRPQSLIDRLG
ncbi:MbtH protein [Catenuloplanes nepalensis]|uniref:MbtH protein n=1 Tax=Catenuloplanes nepalensis TaxID=587533 RepID=A0ABT9MS33_9ACTN|nr:MbtH family protein [Catenuloplanes nepalensis]MDP9794203.1 MbtH protein [Catenuloplanes nepalensis]